MLPWTYAPPDAPLVEVYADRDMVVINKPSGLLSIPGRGPELQDSAETRLAARYGRVYAAHRLDLDTSGLLVFALRRKAEAELHRQFRERLVHKTYLARVAGHPADDAGLIDAALAVEEGAPRSRLDPAGRPARTAWRVLRRDADGTALMELQPETGRSHQLRLHMVALGHPILGDRFYAPPEIAAAAPRLLLHAAELRLLHPFRGDEVRLGVGAPFG